MIPATPFAILVLEREPPGLEDLEAGWTTWLQVVGGLAAAGLAIWWLVWLIRGRRDAGAPVRPWQRWLFLGTLVAALASYGVGLVGPPTVRGTCFVVGGTFALAGLLAPFAADLARLRPRRIWALARLSFKEAIRRKVLWVFLALLLVFLFASWFLPPNRPEDQVRTYVQVVFGAMTPLFLVTAGLVAAFSIPTDLQNQTMHTIVTKPVERFEIVLGRFLGYVILMSLILAAVTAASLLYVFRGVDPSAAFESLRARVPLYGQLELQHGTQRNVQGRGVGREWRYRRYIAGGTPYRAVWTFSDLPAGLADRPQVPCEFAFDIFNLTRSREEAKGVICTLTFRTWQWDPRNLTAFQQERALAGGDPEKIGALAARYGIFEESRRVVDYHTLQVEVPAELFRNALAQPPPPGAAALEVSVQCLEQGHYLGVARHDLYLVEDEGYFGVNFFKGAFGLWCRLCLVIGVAVACSTYLSGVISWVLAMFLYGAGLFQGFLQEVALGQDEWKGRVHGPTEAALRLLNRTPSGLDLDTTATVQLVTAVDEGYRWFLRHILMKVIPDVDRFDWTTHVAEGFSVSALDMGLNLVLLAAYLLPWALLAYYLLKSREIAA